MGMYGIEPAFTLLTDKVGGSYSEWFRIVNSDKITIETRFTGAVTAVTLNIEGAIFEYHDTIAECVYTAANISVAKATFHIINKHVNFIRAYVSVFTYTGTAGLSAWGSYMMRDYTS